MSDDIQFDIDTESRKQSFTSRAVFGKPQVPGLAAWLTRHKMIKDESRAGLVLTIFVILNISAAIAIVYFFVLR